MHVNEYLYTHLDSKFIYNYRPDNSTYPLLFLTLSESIVYVCLTNKEHITGPRNILLPKTLIQVLHVTIKPDDSSFSTLLNVRFT